MKPLSTTFAAIVLALYCYGTPIGPGVAALSEQIARRAQYGQDLANFQSASDVSADAAAGSKDKKSAAPSAIKNDNNDFYDPDPDSTFNDSDEGRSDAAKPEVSPATSLSGDAVADTSSAPADAPSGDADARPFLPNAMPLMPLLMLQVVILLTLAQAIVLLQDQAAQLKTKT
ncbi:hypothetical protein DSO57_1013308 [Entomophthora muscae]|uniref:Uncharacterized protein n=1 Tax=Entomophthora muscae TaxID=34485 RepID=A0ACC2TG71_9FUNG|nr:hypothetical protein DSO57_1013308 [Entomophthora muscae]